MYYNLLIIFICSSLIYLLTKLLTIFIQRRKRKSSVKPFLSTIFYKDRLYEDDNKNILTGILYSEKYSLMGKPDFIFKKSNKLIIVEIKSGNIGNRKKPYDGDLMQVIAYFMIVKSIFPKYKCKYARLVYKDYMFIVKFTKKLEKELIDTLSRMNNMLRNPRFEDPVCDFIKCKTCICRLSVCEFVDF